MNDLNHITRTIRSRGTLTLASGKRAEVVHFTTENGQIKRVCIRYRNHNGFNQTNWMKLATLLKKL